MQVTDQQQPPPTPACLSNWGTCPECHRQNGPNHVCKPKAVAA